MNLLLTSNDKLACADFCIYDARHSCLNIKGDKVVARCKKFKKTELAKLIGKFFPKK